MSHGVSVARRLVINNQYMDQFCNKILMQDIHHVRGEVRLDSELKGPTDRLNQYPDQYITAECGEVHLVV